MRRLETVELDCQSCGACCIANYDAPGYVGVEDEDLDRLHAAYSDRTVKRLTVTESDGLYLRTKENVQGHITCTALSGRVEQRVSCRIYDARPRACMDFKPGSTACRMAREELSR